MLWYEEQGKKCFNPAFVRLVRIAKYRRISRILRGVTIKDAVDHSGSTLLHLSAQHGTRYLTMFFLNAAKIDVNVRNDIGETPLMLASWCKNLMQIDILLDAGADICLKDDKGMSALMIAELYRQNDVMIALFINRIKMCKSNHEIVDLLFKAGCEMPYRFDAFKNAEITKIMLERGASVNEKDKQHNNNSALHAAVEKNDVESIKVLLEFGADKLITNRFNATPFIHAVNREKINLEILELLLPDNVDWTEIKDNSEKMMLHPIFSTGSKKLLEWFLSRCNVDLKVKDNRGQTPIHYLVENENEGIWGLFKNSVFDVNSRDTIRSTALHSACILVNVEAVQFLLDKGADVNALSAMGRSPLHNVFNSRAILDDEAAKYDKCVELLLNYGADIC